MAAADLEALRISVNEMQPGTTKSLLNKFLDHRLPFMDIEQLRQSPTEIMRSGWDRADLENTQSNEEVQSNDLNNEDMIKRSFPNINIYSF